MSLGPLLVSLSRHVGDGTLRVTTRGVGGSLWCLRPEQAQVVLYTVSPESLSRTNKAPLWRETREGLLRKGRGRFRFLEFLKRRPLSIVGILGRELEEQTLSKFERSLLLQK